MVATSSFAGWSPPLPGLMTLVARPDAVFVASAGAAATSEGGGTVDGGAVCADPAAAVNRSTKIGRMLMTVILPVLSCATYLAGFDATAEQIPTCALVLAES